MYEIDLICSTNPRFDLISTGIKIYIFLKKGKEEIILRTGFTISNLDGL